MNKQPDFAKINWNDLKYFLALKRQGRLCLASRKIGCSHVSIANRIAALEECMSTKLFYQNSRGFHLTKAGEKLVPYAEKCELELRLAMEVYRQEQKIRSKIRIGVTEGIGNYFITPRLASWIRDKDIDIELISLPSLTTITTGEVDISITLGPQKGYNIIQQRLTPYKIGIYASRDYVTNNPPIRGVEDLLQHYFIGYIEEHVFSEDLRYHEEISPNLQIVFKSTTIHTQRLSIETGLGLGLLPHYVAHGNPNLVHLLPEIQFKREYWISSGTDLHQFKDLKRTWDFILSATAESKTIFLP